jgi:hypothetical protein
MSAGFRTDSKGRTHYILFQELTMSCGPACVAMAEEIFKQACLIDPEGRARQISQNYEGRFTATGGTNVTNLAYVLNALSVPAYAATDCSARLYDYLHYYVKDRTPTIAHISWASGGGHFTLCRIVDDDGTMVFLDPWYGVVEVRRSNLPNYNATGATGTLSGWLVITHR